MDHVALNGMQVAVIAQIGDEAVADLRDQIRFLRVAIQELRDIQDERSARDLMEKLVSEQAYPSGESRAEDIGRIVDTGEIPWWFEEGTGLK